MLNAGTLADDISMCRSEHCLKVLLPVANPDKSKL